MTEQTETPNISTENQPEGAALNPSDTLDKPSATTTPPRTDLAGKTGSEVAPEPGFATNGE